MKKFIFYSIPGHGHTNPTLNVARELSRKGNKVIYYSIEEFRDKIESAGLEFRCYNMDRYFDPIVARDLALFAKKLMQLSVEESPFLIKEAKEENPDCIVYDTLNMWGKIVGHTLRIPSVSLFTTFAFNNTVAIKYPKMYTPVLKAILKGNHSIPAITTYLKLCRKYGISPDLSTNFLLAKDKLNLVFTSSLLQPCSKSFDNSFKFTGPSIYPRNENSEFLKKIDTKKKIIYISMGTIFTDNVHFYRNCIETFAKTDYQVIISLGKRISVKDLPEIPDNIIIRNHIPQLEVLQKADLFITHAGMNSINESLYYDVPMVLIPQMYEQAFNAFRVQELGAGMYFKPKHVSADKLLKCIEKVIHTKSYFTNAEKIGKSLRDAGGYKKATDEILEYIEN